MGDKFLVLLIIFFGDTSKGKVVNHWIFFIDASGSVVNSVPKSKSYKKFLTDSLLKFIQNSDDVENIDPSNDYSSVVYFGILPNNVKRPVIKNDLTVDSIPCSISLLERYYFEKDYIHEKLPPDFHDFDSLKKALFPQKPHYCFTFLSIAEPSVFIYLSRYGKKLKGKIGKTFLILVSDDNYNDYECYHELRFLRSIGGKDYLEKLSKFEKTYYLDLIYSKSFRIGNYDWGFYLYEVKNLKVEQFFSQYKNKQGINWIKNQKLYNSWLKPLIHYKLYLSPIFVKSAYSNFNVKNAWLTISLYDSLISENLKIKFPVSQTRYIYKIDTLPITPMKYVFKASPKILLNAEIEFVVYDTILGSQSVKLEKFFKFERPKTLEYFGKALITVFMLSLFIFFIIDSLIIIISCLKFPLKFNVQPGLWNLAFGSKVKPMSKDYNVNCELDLSSLYKNKILVNLPLIKLIFQYLYRHLSYGVCRIVFMLSGNKLIFEVTDINNAKTTIKIDIDKLDKTGKIIHTFPNRPRSIKLKKPFEKKPIEIEGDSNE